MGATFVRNSSRGSSFGDKLGLSNRSSVNSLADHGSGIPNPHQLMELIKNSRRDSNSSLGNTLRKKGLNKNPSCSSLSDLSSTDSNYLQSRESLTKIMPALAPALKEKDQNVALQVESPKAILSKPYALFAVNMDRGVKN